MRSPKRALLAIVAFAARLSIPALADAAAPKPSVGTPTGAVVEKVVFEGVLPFEQGLVLDRIGVKPGDVLTSSKIERIARQLLTLRVPHSPSYQEGTKPGRVVLSIGAGC